MPKKSDASFGKPVLPPITRMARDTDTASKEVSSKVGGALSSSGNQPPRISVSGPQPPGTVLTAELKASPYRLGRYLVDSELGKKGEKCRATTVRLSLNTLKEKYNPERLQSRLKGAEKPSEVDDLFDGLDEGGDAGLLQHASAVDGVPEFPDFIDDCSTLSDRGALRPDIHLVKRTVSEPEMLDEPSKDVGDKSRPDLFAVLDSMESIDDILSVLLENQEAETEAELAKLKAEQDQLLVALVDDLVEDVIGADISAVSLTIHAQKDHQVRAVPMSEEGRESISYSRGTSRNYDPTKDVERMSFMQFIQDYVEEEDSVPIFVEAMLEPMSSKDRNRFPFVVISSFVSRGEIDKAEAFVENVKALHFSDDRSDRGYSGEDLLSDVPIHPESRVIKGKPMGGVLQQFLKSLISKEKAPLSEKKRSSKMGRRVTLSATNQLDEIPNTFHMKVSEIESVLFEFDELRQTLIASIQSELDGGKSVSDFPRIETKLSLLATYRARVEKLHTKSETLAANFKKSRNDGDEDTVLLLMTQANRLANGEEILKLAKQTLFPKMG